MMQTAVSNPARQKLTFEEYLLYEGEIDVRYELFEGRLEAMTPPKAIHAAICEFLAAIFQRQIALNSLPLVVKSNIGVRTNIDSSRIPDVIVCSRSLWEELTKRGGAGVFDTGEAPLLIVEVVSEDWRQDYIRKRAEYALINTSEYWVVDPHKQRIWILTEPDSENGYERAEFIEGETIISSVFPGLMLSVNDILSPTLVEDLILQEQQILEQESQRADAEQYRAEQSEQKAKKLADYLGSQGIDPETL